MLQRNRLAEAAVDVVNLGLGVFLFVSAWLFELPPGIEKTTSLMAGATIAIVAVLSIVNLFEFVSDSEWFQQAEWINLVVGLWVAVCPWIIGFHADMIAMDVHFVVGLMIAAIAADELWLLHHKPHEHA
ncbi:MAG: SPW repeat protein [Rhodospirillales bacterium]|nr:SPW repeat protein [Rhodospirillales bacterium]